MRVHSRNNQGKAPAQQWKPTDSLSLVLPAHKNEYKLETNVIWRFLQFSENNYCLAWWLQVRKVVKKKAFPARQLCCSKNNYIKQYTQIIRQAGSLNHQLNSLIMKFVLDVHQIANHYSNTYIIREVLIDYSKGKFVDLFVFVLLKEFNLVQTCGKIPTIISDLSVITI